jgi:hypothetical protein
MTKAILSVLLAMIGATVAAQENLAIFSGGYSFANLEGTDEKATGWRLNASYEVLVLDSKLSHGFAAGYIGTRASTTFVKFNISSFPLYYAPKFTFGEQSLKGFVKGVIGWHFSTINREGTAVNPVDRDNGFYTGLALGGMKEVNDKIAITLEYEWAFMYNSFYREGFMNSIQLGVGYLF